MNIQSLFKLAMDRTIPDLIPDTNLGKVLNLGGGNKEIKGAVNLQLPNWNAESGRIPFADESVRQIHAYHFLEHINNPIQILAECQRVLIVGGHVNILVPYYKCEMAVQDLDHKKLFSAEYLKQTFSNPYYDSTANKHEWRFEIKANMIIGIVDRNIGILSQIVKV